MENLRQIVGENLAELRKANHLTQYELAEKLNYSDKSISKWENGDTLPDIETLNDICKFYGVTLDYLTHPVKENKSSYIISNKKDTFNQIMILSLIDSIVWMIATIVFVYSLLYSEKSYWTVFVYAVPVTCLITLYYLRKKIVTPRLTYFIIWTVLVWSLISSFFCGFLYNGIIVWPLFILGVPAEISLGLWAFIKKSKV